MLTESLGTVMNNKRLLKIAESINVNDAVRCIQVFPQPYLMNVTPYRSYDFSPQISAKCSRMSCVKMSKAVVVGDQAVGKSSLLQRFCYNTFKSDYKCTVGVDFEVEKFQLFNMIFKVQFWDTAGQERFKCIAASYYRGSKAVIVVFDMSSIQSLMNAKQWATEACAHATTIVNENTFIGKNSANSHAKTNNIKPSACNGENRALESDADNKKNDKQLDKPLLFLVGTKKDLVSDRTWMEVEAMAITVAKDINAELWIVSSKTGERVNDFFSRLAALLFEKSVENDLTLESPNTNGLQFASDMIKIEDQSLRTSSSSINCCK